MCTGKKRNRQIHGYHMSAWDNAVWPSLCNGMVYVQLAWYASLDTSRDDRDYWHVRNPLVWLYSLIPLWFPMRLDNTSRTMRQPPRPGLLQRGWRGTNVILSDFVSLISFVMKHLNTQTFILLSIFTMFFSEGMSSTLVVLSPRYHQTLVESMPRVEALLRGCKGSIRY